jgi:hypothetical protein
MDLLPLRNSDELLLKIERQLRKEAREDLRDADRIGVGTKDKLRPSLRTGQANFSHPALQLVVSLLRRSADASRAPFRLSTGWLLLPGRPTDAVQQSKVCILALLFTVWSPEDIRGACFLRSFVRCLHLPASLGSTGITPLLRYYRGSVTFRARYGEPSGEPPNPETGVPAHRVRPRPRALAFHPENLAFVCSARLLRTVLPRMSAPLQREGICSWLVCFPTRHR